MNQTGYDWRCARGRDCAERERLTTPDGTTTLGVLIRQERGLCPSCTRHVHTAIRALPMDYTELHTLMGATTTSVGEKVTTSRTPPIPINVHREALQRAIVEHATRWAEPVAERLNIAWDDRHIRPGVAVQCASRLLADGLEVFLALPPIPVTVWVTGTHWALTDLDGIDGALTLLGLHDDVRRTAGRTNLVHHLPAPCPSCDRLALQRNNGADYVHCAHCHDRWTESDYRRLCLVLTVDHGPGTEAA